MTRPTVYSGGSIRNSRALSCMSTHRRERDNMASRAGHLFAPGTRQAGSHLTSGSTTMKRQDERPESVSVRAILMAYARPRAGGRIWNRTDPGFHLAAFSYGGRFGHRHCRPGIARRDSVGIDVLVESAGSDRAAEASLQNGTTNRGRGRVDWTSFSARATHFDLSPR